MTQQTDNVKAMFNEMSDEYDNLNDLWYQYTFANIDKVLTSNFRRETESPKPIALDVGCGTGIQSLRLAKLGYKVIGIDISDKLVEKAKEKLIQNGFTDAEFYVVDAEVIPYPDNYFDAINCCGPTLPFIEKWENTLSEMSRSLKPGGKFLLEVEGKWNFDIFWEVINAIGFDFLGYEEGLMEALSHFKNPFHGHKLDYSFKLESGETVSMPLKLFTVSEIKNNLSKNNFVVKHRWGLHSITNIIPSTILHDAKTSKFTKGLFNFLSRIEVKVNRFYPFNSFACSLLLYSEKSAK